MTSRKSLIQNTLDRIQKGEHPESLTKKRRFSRIILLVDILIVILIFAFVYNRTPEKLYISTTITHDDIEYRFSITRNTSDRGIMASLSLTSHAGSKKNLRYSPSIAGIKISSGEEIAYTGSLGEKTTNLTLLPGELKTFVKKIDSQVFKTFTLKHRDKTVQVKKSIFSTQNDYIPYHAIFKINQAEKIATTLNFDFEVE